MLAARAKVLLADLLLACAACVPHCWVLCLC